MQSSNSRRSSGFTIVELSIVMVFISLLLLAVVSVTIYAGKAYTKGVTLKTLNQVGREVTDSIRRDIASAPNPSDISYVSSGGAGRLCTGTVSYIWNSASLLSNPTGSTVKDSSSNNPVRLARIEDSSKSYCSSPFPVAITGNWTEMLQANNTDFAVHAMSMVKFSPDDDLSQALYRIVMTLGTNQLGTVSGSGSDASCKPPTDNTANFDFCTVRSFDMVIRAGGGA